MGENERRRDSAREMWLTQLTPEQRAEIDAARQASICSAHREPDPDCPRCPVVVGCGCLGEGVYACPHWPGRLREHDVNCHEDSRAHWMDCECWCHGPSEALQRSIERRD